MMLGGAGTGVGNSYTSGTSVCAGEIVIIYYLRLSLWVIISFLSSNRDVPSCINSTLEFWLIGILSSFYCKKGIENNAEDIKHNIIPTPDTAVIV